MKSANLQNFIFCCLLIFTACQNQKFDTANLYGSWEVQEWKIEETGKLVNNTMDMKFDEAGLYSIDYGPKSESGKYWISGEFLHTVETDQAEKKVKIIRLDSDKMEIKMNRGGKLEHVILLKQP